MDLRISQNRRIRSRQRHPRLRVQHLQKHRGRETTRNSGELQVLFVAGVYDWELGNGRKRGSVDLVRNEFDIGISKKI